jgi:hypothetical protein
VAAHGRQRADVRAAHPDPRRAHALAADFTSFDFTAPFDNDREATCPMYVTLLFDRRTD